jgi:ribose transport system substrate-binding protein
VKSMKANWTEESSRKTVSSWLRLRTSQESRIDLVGAQDDSMAMGARKAFSEIPEAERARWLKIPITGCDGMPKTGQAWVKNGMLAATIFIRPNTDLAIEMLVEAFKGAQLPEQKITAPESVPSLADLAALGKKAKSAKV